MTSRLSHRQRLESALEGGVEVPPVAGLAFVPPETLMGAGARGSDDPAEVLAATVADFTLDFAFVPADAPWAVEAVERLQRLRRGVLWVVDGPLWPVLRRHGIGETLKTIAWDPGDLEADLEAETSRAQDAVLEGSRLGVDAVVVADDLAGSDGPLVSPDYVNEHLVARYALIIATAASGGLRSVLHSDGDIRVFLPGIARAGFIAIHGGGGLLPEPFERLLQAARDQGLMLLGGLDTRMLDEGPVVAVRAGTQAGVYAAGGGLIITDDGGITVADQVAGLATAFGAAGVGR